MIVFRHKWLVALAVVVGVLVAIAASVYRRSQAERSQRDSMLGIVSQAYAAADDSAITLRRGSVADGSAGTFMLNGESLVSLKEAADALGAEIDIDDSTHVITVTSNSCVSQFMASFNVVVFNDEPIIMRQKPIEKGGDVYLPGKTVAKLFNESFQRDYNNGITVIGGSKALSGADFQALAKELGVSYGKQGSNADIDRIISQSGNSMDVYALARDGRLYVSNGEATLERWLLLDDFTIETAETAVAQEFPRDVAFYVGSGSEGRSLFVLGTDSVYSQSPEEIEKNDMIFAMSEYTDGRVHGAGAELLQCYKDAVSGLYTDQFRAVKTAARQAGEYQTAIDNAGAPEPEFEEQWEQLYQAAQAGDILLCRNSDSSSTHGYYNHTALVMAKNEAEEQLQVLQSRSHELGVGADLPIDFISPETVMAEAYWTKYDVIALARAKGVTAEQAGQMAENAYRKFNGYGFGYGGYYGAREATCAQIPEYALESVGVALFSEPERQHRIKSAITGDAMGMIVLPDDFALSDNIELLAVARRGGE